MTNHFISPFSESKAPAQTIQQTKVPLRKIKLQHKVLCIKETEEYFASPYKTISMYFDSGSKVHPGEITQICSVETSYQSPCFIKISIFAVKRCFQVLIWA